MRRSAFAVLLLISLAACSKPASIEVTDAWTRDSVGRTGSAAIFMTITSSSADRLLGASTAAARKTDLMTMESADGTMAMTYLDAIDIPADRPVRLDPAGLHVWLEGLNQPLNAGESILLTLEFEQAGEREVRVKVVEPTAASPMSGMEM